MTIQGGVESFDDSMVEELDTQVKAKPLHIELHVLARLQRDLSEIPDLYKSCEVIRVNPNRRLRDRVSGSRKVDIPLDEDAMALRADFIRVLTLWGELVVAERHCPAPRSRDAEVLTDYLVEQLDWFSVHPAGRDFAEEISRIAEAAREYLHMNSVLRRELGMCVHHGCDARAFVYLTGVGDAPAGVRCEAGHSWEATQWLAVASKFAANEWKVSS